MVLIKLFCQAQDSGQWQQWGGYTLTFPQRNHTLDRSSVAHLIVMDAL